MLEKWKKWALQMNLKKAVFIFVAVSVVSVIGLFAAMCGICKRKAFQWESADSLPVVASGRLGRG